MNSYLSIYNEQYENTGECKYAEYLGCKQCPTCKVEEYEQKVKRILDKKNEEEQRKLKELYGAEDKSSIYENDEKCVYNEESDAFKKVKELDDIYCEDEFYSGIKDLQMDVCYDCNRCGIWGK